jgi:hypothetical protein
MKKLMTLMIGLAFLTGTVATAFAQEKQEPTKKEEKKKKKGKKKKTGEEKPQPPAAQ